MSDQEVKKPSDFALSRYILNECDSEEKRRIESWISSSEETRHDFEKYRNTILQHEQNAPCFSRMFFSTTMKKKCSVPPIIYRVKFRHVFAYAAFIVLVCISAMSVNFIRNCHTGSHLQELQKNQIYSGGFRDTLEALLQLTCTAQNQEVFSCRGDLTAYQTVSTYVPVQKKSYNRAERTMVFKD